MSPLEVGPIYAPGAGPPHPDLQRRRARAAVATLPVYQPPPPPSPFVAQPIPVAAAPPVAVEQPTVVVPPPAAARAPAAAHEHRRFDWVLGVVIGVVLGLGIAAAFVFIGSEDTVDAPRVHGVENAKTGRPTGAPPSRPERLQAE